MDEFLSMDLALAMISANEAIAFFDEFYDKRNNYAEAYEAVKFQPSDSVGNASRSGKIFGKEHNASISGNAKMFDKFKYHATSMLIHIYNAIEKIFTVILDVIKAIGKLIIAPFKLAYKAITGGEIGKTAEQEIDAAISKYRKDFDKHLNRIIDTDVDIINSADHAMNTMYPTINDLSKVFADARFTEKKYEKNDVNGLKDMNEILKSKIADAKIKVEESSNVINQILDRASADVSKIRKHRKDLKGSNREIVLSYSVRPSVINTLQRTSASIEKSADNAIKKTKNLAAKAKGTEVDSRAVQAAKACNEIANSCLSAVRIYRDSLIALKLAPGSENTANAD